MKYIVSDKHRFVYFVVQKVACSSIKTALLPLFDLDPEPYRGVNPLGKPTLRIHKLFNQSSHQIGKDNLLFGLESGYRDYFKFAFVRNPWDRLVSCYFQKLTGKRRRLVNPPPESGIDFNNGMPFAEFVEAVHQIPDEEADVHFRSQHVTLCKDEKGQIMADFVGRFENLAFDFEVVARRLSNGSNLELPHVLPSIRREKRPYAELYDERLKRLVHERFRKDIDLFGYTF